MNDLMQRKHRSQMSYEEISFVETLIHSMQGWTIESALIHASKKGRTFTREQVIEALQRGQVIEVNSFGRVLMRSNKGTCVVASLRGALAITVWFNRPNDNHKTLRREEYQWRVNVIEYLKSQVGR